MATRRIDQLTAHPKSAASPLTPASLLMARDAALSSDNTRKVTIGDLTGATVNVKNYGAVGDGTTDDTAAIQATFNAAGNGGCVFFPRGKYKITSAITNAAVALRVIGEGGGSQVDGGYNGSSILVSTTNQIGLDFNHGGALQQSGPCIEHLNFIDNSSTGNATLVRIDNMDYGSFRTCFFRPKDGSPQNTVGCGIYFTHSFDGNGDCAWHYITGCSFYGCKVAIDGDGSYTMLGGSVFSAGTAFHNNQIGVRLAGTATSQIIGVKFDGGQTTGHIAIHVNGSGWSKIIGCHFERNETCIQIDANAGPFSNSGTQTQIIGNAITDLNTTGVRIGAGVIGTTIIGNVYNGMAAGAAGRVVDNAGAGNQTMRIETQNNAENYIYTVANGSTDRALNVTADTTAQVAAVLGSLIADLRAQGIVG